MMKKMSDILKNTFSQERSPTGNMSTRDFLTLIDHWNVLLPGLIAENSVPFRLKGRELHIATTHPALAQELSFMERDILLKIFKHYPQWSKKLDKLNFKYYPKFSINSFVRVLKNEHGVGPTKFLLNSDEISSLSSNQKHSLKISSTEIKDEEIRSLLNKLIDKL